MKNILKRCSLFLAVLCAIAFTCISATESNDLIRDFNAVVSGKDPSFIKTHYDIYKTKSTDEIYKKNLLEAAALQSMDWIFASALKKNFGFTDNKELENRESLKRTLLAYKDDALALNLDIDTRNESINETLLVRTLFYPTEEEIVAIENNTNGLKDKLVEILQEWVEWHKKHIDQPESHYRFYNKEDIEIKHLKEVLKRLVAA